MSEQFQFVKFRKSRTLNKKYDMIIRDKNTKRLQTVPFGDTRYEHYMDSALGHYSHLNHYDEKRRKAYLARHEKTRHKKFSASWASAVFLWGASKGR